MKRIILLGIFCFLFTGLHAQQTTDSVAYQLQRKKINAMLAERSRKFGQYDVSLNEHTGIFGLQTKKDIRRSNDILMDIVKTDNTIYKQIKILLDYRAFQQQLVVEKSKEILDKSKETEGNALGFMYTINKLQAQVAKLKKLDDENESKLDKASRNFIIIVTILLVIILLLLRKQIRSKKQLT